MLEPTWFLRSHVKNRNEMTNPYEYAEHRLYIASITYSEMNAVHCAWWAMYREWDAFESATEW